MLHLMFNSHTLLSPVLFYCYSSHYAVNIINLQYQNSVCIMVLLPHLYTSRNYHYSYYEIVCDFSIYILMWDTTLQCSLVTTMSALNWINVCCSIVNAASIFVSYMYSHCCKWKCCQWNMNYWRIDWNEMIENQKH